MIYDYDDLLVENDIAFLEAYQGKSNSIKKIEAQVGKARSKYLGKVIASGIYNDKEFVKLGDMIADEFGFKVIDFNLINNSDPNSMTVLVGSSMDALYDDSSAKIDASGHKFKKKKLSTIIRATTGLWNNPEFTDGEVTALILHEVGHNFQHARNSNLKTYGTVMGAINIIAIIMQAVSITGIPTALQQLFTRDSTVRAEFNKAIKTSDKLSNIANVGSEIIGVIRRIFNEAFALIDTLTVGAVKGGIGMTSMAVLMAMDPINSIVSMITTPVGKGTEYISDNFAAELGYGPELISAFSKIDLDPNTSASTIDAMAKKLPLFDSICTLFSLPTMIFASLFNAHPMTPKRASNIVRDLEEELKKSNVTPKMKKEIQVQIDEIKSTIDRYTKIYGIADGLALKKAIFKMFSNYDKDPKGYMTKKFTDRDLHESQEYDDLIIESELYLIESGEDLI